MRTELANDVRSMRGLLAISHEEHLSLETGVAVHKSEGAVFLAEDK